jgi:16S rRNA (cytidine1402-2'-O)-methyltransferase
MAQKGTLYLVPTPLGGDAAAVLPTETLRVVMRTTSFIVENAKSARAFLKAVGYPSALQAVEFLILNEHTPEADLAHRLAPLLAGKDCALLSESGCPAVADPGAALVRLAHTNGIRVVPLVGPSAILLALMASGLNGQRFAFHGYLPREKDARRASLRKLEQVSADADQTQIFIEAPYRNETLLQALLDVCREDTLLCLATDLTLPTESVCTRAIADWKKKPPAVNRRPTVFLLYRRKSRG